MIRTQSVQSVPIFALNLTACVFSTITYLRPSFLRHWFLHPRWHIERTLLNHSLQSAKHILREQITAWRPPNTTYQSELPLLSLFRELCVAFLFDIDAVVREGGSREIKLRT
jgi:hypothetical protein